MYKDQQLDHCFALQNSLHLSLSLLFAIGLCVSISACSSPEQVDYSLEPRNLSAKNKLDRPVGSIKLHMTDAEEPYAVNLGRIRGGYQLYTAGPAFKNEKERTELESLWFISRDKYKDWYAGFKGSYKF